MYIPLGGSRPNIPEAIRLKGDKASEARYKKAIAIRNTFVIFLLSGLWHGANWTFVLWGAYHALLFVPLLIMNKNRRYRDTVATITLPDGTIKTKWLPSLKEACQMLVTFAFAVFGWIIFRATGMKTLMAWMTGICDSSLFSMPLMIENSVILFISICIMLLVEWINRNMEHGLQLSIRYKWLRLLIYYVLIILCIFNMGQEQTFIYFQF